MNDCLNPFVVHLYRYNQSMQMYARPCAYKRVYTRSSKSQSGSALANKCTRISADAEGTIDIPAGTDADTLC